MGLTVHFEVLNQLGTPMMYSDTLAKRPAAGIAGRIFFRTDSPYGIFRDTGSAWDQIGTGTVTSTNIYNSNGTLTGNRTVNFAGNTLNFNSEFTFTPNNGSTAPTLDIFNSTFGGRLSLGYGLLAVGGGQLSLSTTGGQNININNQALFVKATGNTIFQNGGTFVDAGYRVDIQGAARISSYLSLTNATGYITFGSASFPSIISANGQNLNIYNYNNGPTGTTGGLNIGAIGEIGYLGTGQQYTGAYFKSNMTDYGVGNTGQHNEIQIAGSVNFTFAGPAVQRSIYINKTIIAQLNYRSIEWTNNLGWGLYGSGTALNYLGGSLGVKTAAIYQPSTFSLDINGGLLIKNTAGITAQLTLINADPSIGGNNGFLVQTVGGTSGSSYVDFQGYYGTSITGSTALRLNPSGGPVIVNSTTNTGEQLQITGTLRVNGQRSGSAGGASGQHLIINCDGVSYKIALLNP